MCHTHQGKWTLLPPWYTNVLRPPAREEPTVNQTAALYRLQTLDSEIDAIRKRLAEISEQLNQNEAVQAAQVALAEAEAVYRHWHTQQTNLEMERAKLKGEAEAAEESLYSGKVKNPRELTDLQDKVAELRRRHESLDEPLLEAMYGIEENERAVKKAKSALERVVEEQAQTLGTLTDEQAELSARLSKLESQTEQIRAGIPPDYLASYDRLRQQPTGIAIAQIKGDECSACGVQLTSQLVFPEIHKESLMVISLTLLIPGRRMVEKSYWIRTKVVSYWTLLNSPHKHNEPTSLNQEKKFYLTGTRKNKPS